MISILSSLVGLQALGSIIQLLVCYLFRYFHSYVSFTTECTSMYTKDIALVLYTILTMNFPTGEYLYQHKSQEIVARLSSYTTAYHHTTEIYLHARQLIAVRQRGSITIVDFGAQIKLDLRPPRSGILTAQLSAVMASLTPLLQHYRTMPTVTSGLNDHVQHTERCPNHARAREGGPGVKIGNWVPETVVNRRDLLPILCALPTAAAGIYLKSEHHSCDYSPRKPLFKCRNNEITSIVARALQLVCTKNCKSPK